MRQIPLTQDQLALVDDDDFAILSQFRWCYRAERDHKQGYAVRHRKIDGKDRLAYLHREIMAPAPGLEVIFLNHDRLDCRRANLRVVTKEEARRHHRVRSDSKSGVKGVHFNHEGRTWSAFTYRHGHCYNIGTFYTQGEAVRAYEEEVAKENPDLAKAPIRVERRELLTDEQNPDQRQEADRAGCKR
jgi:hypothetical protein